MNELQLRDIHLPESSLWWPPAPGWWILALLLIAFCVPSYAAPRFVALDIIIESTQPLAAWQFELSDRSGQMKVVGIENGDSPAFPRAPFYDRDAVNTGNAERIVVADYSLERDNKLPSGATRVATVHVVLDGDDSNFDLKLITATASDGRRISAVARIVQK